MVTRVCVCVVVQSKQGAEQHEKRKTLLKLYARSLPCIQQKSLLARLDADEDAMALDDNIDVADGVMGARLS